VRRVWDVFHVLLGRTFVSGQRTKKPKNLNNLKTFNKFQKPRFFPALVW